MSIAFELAIESTRAIAVAERIGADRIEVCAALAVHGVTPSAALIERAVASSVPAHVLVRPRPGGFAYAPDEIALMSVDVRRAVDAGAAGVVIGGTHDGAIDANLVRAMKDAAGSATVTFHRAFDTVADPRAALDELVALGVARVLTSGGRGDAEDNLTGLRALAEHASGNIEIVAGGAVTSANAARIADVGVDALHASARRRPAPTVDFADVDESEARSIRTALRAVPVRRVRLTGRDT